jgi:hypothetical protein
MTTFEIVNAMAFITLVMVVVAAGYYYFNYNGPDGRKPAAIRVRVEQNRRGGPASTPRQKRQEVNEVGVIVWLLLGFGALWFVMQQI